MVAPKRVRPLALLLANWLGQYPEACTNLLPVKSTKYKNKKQRNTKATKKHGEIVIAQSSILSRATICCQSFYLYNPTLLVPQLMHILN